MKDEMLRMLRGNISDRVVEAMDRTSRELFVPDGIRHMAYEDHPLPIGESQTISAPHMVAIMCDVLDIHEGMKVLDVGTGSGYHAAVMADLVGPEGHVYSIERIPELVVYAKRNLREAGIENVTVVEGDGSCGLRDFAPYDRINVAATAPKVPAGGPRGDLLPGARPGHQGRGGLRAGAPRRRRLRPPHRRSRLQDLKEGAKGYLDLS
jgi:protein-L-isoaspartate(D-aspartate) O-methyltransferase